MVGSALNPNNNISVLTVKADGVDFLLSHKLRLFSGSFCRVFNEAALPLVGKSNSLLVYDDTGVSGAQTSFKSP